MTGAETGVFRGNGGGTFQPQVTYASASGASALAASDLDGDGRMDLVLTREGGLSALFGQAAGSLGAQMDWRFSVDFQSGNAVLCTRTPDYVTDFSSLDFRAMAVGDFNGDTRPDVVLAAAWYQVVFVLFNQGNRAFALPPWCP
jgi:hypothetical protein